MPTAVTAGEASSAPVACNRRVESVMASTSVRPESADTAALVAIATNASRSSPMSRIVAFDCYSGGGQPLSIGSRMPGRDKSEIAAALLAVDRRAGSALDQAFAAYYPELKKIAHARLRGSGLNGSMQTTALVHDSYLRLASGPGITVGDRLQFFAYSSRVLRSIVVDLVREERALRHGGGRDLVTLDTAAGEGVPASVDIETVNDALESLAKLDPSLARLVEMRFFGGMTEDEIAEALGVSARTVSREWKKARALLLTLVGD
jgi:RNA polymerase sigma factor (TIGR02999 family)